MEEKTHTISDTEIFKITLTSEGKKALKSAGHWAFIIAVLAAIWIIFSFGMQIFTMFKMYKTPIGQEDSFSNIFLVQGFLSLLISIFYAFPAYFLYTFSEKAKKGVAINNPAVVGQSFENLKNFFKYVVAAIVLMVLFYTIFALTMLESFF